VQAEIDAYIDEEERNWCGLDEFVIARYVAGECSSEEARRVEAAIEQSDHVRDCIALLQEDDLVQIGPIDASGGKSPSDRSAEIAAYAVTTMVSKTPSAHDVKPTSSSKSPWLLAVTMLVALGVQTWYFRQQLESQTKENSRIVAQIAELKTNSTKSMPSNDERHKPGHEIAQGDDAGANDPRKSADDQTKLTDSEPPAKPYDEPIPNASHAVAKILPMPASYWKPPTVAASKVSESDTRLSVRGLLGMGVPYRTARYVNEEVVKVVPEKGADGKPVERTVRETVMKQIYGGSETRFVTASVVGLADDDLLSLPPIGELIPQIDEQKSPLVQWAIAEILRSKQWKDQHPIAEITAKLLQRNDGGQAAAKYVLSGELWGEWPPDDVQIEQGLTDKSTFSQWAALYTLIQRKSAARTLQFSDETESLPPDVPVPEATEDVPSTKSISPTKESKDPMGGTNGDTEGIGKTNSPKLPATYYAPASALVPSEFDLRVLKRVNEFLASKEKSQVRLAAVYLIGEYGPAGKISEAHLIRILEESNHPLESRWAAYALGKIRASSPQALSQLVNSLDDTNPRVPPAAAFALTLILADTPNAAVAEIARTKLRIMLQASDPAVRHWGAYALQRLNP